MVETEVLYCERCKMSYFEDALAVILKEEGGFVNDPADPGGATNFGITQKTYDKFLFEIGTKPKTTVEDITPAEVRAIYHNDYWLSGSCDGIESYPVALIHFDGCVNSGVKSAGKLLQRAINEVHISMIGDTSKPVLTVDGMVGPLTIEKANLCPSHYLFMIIWAARIAYYRKISDGNTQLRKFLRNWIVRMEHVKEAAGI